jgi:hypothetical protein
MPRLSKDDLDAVRPILETLREQLLALAGDDTVRLHSLRRYLAKRLEFDERGTPAQRRKLKDLMWKRQRGICAECGEELPESETELDRVVAHIGYVEDNVRLVHHVCHRKSQAERKFA